MQFLIRSVILNRLPVLSCCNGYRNFHRTTLVCLDQKWRRDHKLPVNPISDSPLTNLPDYSFLDGRPVPLGSRQKQRMIKQKDFALKIVTMCEELKFAKENHKTRIENEVKSKQFTSKLKPKGHLLLKK